MGIKHIVLFSFKVTATDEIKREVITRFKALKDAIPEVLDFEWGKDISVENLHMGFSHAFILTFKSIQDRDSYLPHPVHQEFSQFVKPYLEKVLVFDYQIQ